MNRSESIVNISLALSEFQNEVNKIDRNSQGYNYHYASLENVLDNIREPLNKAGLVFSQFPTGDYGLTTILVHPQTGEFFETTSQLVPIKDDPQGRGSSITYNRRYHLVSILGLNVEDDDAASASGKTKDNSNKKQTAVKTTELPWLNKSDKIYQLAIDKLSSGETTLGKIKSKYRLSAEVEKELLNAQKQEE